jgi:hypothetical protein
MAANFIELQEEVSNEALTDLNQEGSTIPDAVETVSAQPEEIAPEVEVPDKYRGKSLEEVVRMHQESEKLIGRQAQEVGEVRKLADSLIKQQLEKKHDAPQPSPAQEIDWYEDPEKAVNRAVENNPILKQLQENQLRQIQMNNRAMLEQSHPDFMGIVQSEDFTNWVKESRIRIQLLANAENYDLDSALELLGNYKSTRNLKQQNTQAADQSLKKADDEGRAKSLKAASVQQGGTGESSKPIYRRADLIRLKMQDPARYESLADDILSAYAEGRVR